MDHVSSRLLVVRSAVFIRGLSKNSHLMKMGFWTLRRFEIIFHYSSFSIRSRWWQSNPLCCRVKQLSL